MSRPNYNKTTGQTYTAAEWQQLKDKNNNPGLNDAWSSVVKFDDEYYPPEQTISSDTEYTIDATNAGTGNGRCDTIIASGNRVLTFTGFTIKKSDITPTGQTITLVDGDSYTILFIRRGSVSEVYFTSNNNSTPVVYPTVTSMVVENADPNTVIVNFSEAVDITNVTGWTFRIDAVGETLNSVLGTGTNQLSFAFTTSVIGGEVLDMAYDSGIGNVVSTSTSNSLQTFTTTTVTNNVSGVDYIADNNPKMWVKADEPGNFTLSGNEIQSGTSKTPGTYHFKKGTTGPDLISSEIISVKANSEKITTDGVIAGATVQADFEGDAFPLSFAVVVKLDSLDASNEIFSIGGEGPSTSAAIRIRGAATTFDVIRYYTNPTEVNLESFGTSDTSNYHIISGYFTGSAITVFLDGTKVVDAVVFSAVAGSLSTITSVLTGGYDDRFGDHKIKELAIFNTSLGDTIISNINTQLNNQYSVY